MRIAAHGAFSKQLKQARYGRISRGALTSSVFPNLWDSMGHYYMEGDYLREQL
jgi:hypothetical protein